MNLIPIAEEKLRKYNAHSIAAENIKSEIKILEQEISCICIAGINERWNVTDTSAEDEQNILSKIMLLKELERSLAIAKLNIETVDRALAVLDKTEKLILIKMEIYKKKNCVNELCDALGVERTTIYRIRDKAIKQFTCALFGCVSTEDLARKLDQELKAHTDIAGIISTHHKKGSNYGEDDDRDVGI